MLVSLIRLPRNKTEISRDLLIKWALFFICIYGLSEVLNATFMDV